MKQALLAMGAVLALALASTATAKPLDAQNIPADAKWLMHFDVDNFRETRLAEYIRREKLDDPQAQRWLDWVEERYGINLRKDLHGMTAYGTSYEPHHGVILLFGDYDREKTVSVIKDEPDFKTSEYGDYTLYTWSMEKHKQHQEGPRDEQEAQHDHPQKMTLTAAFHDKGVVIAASPESVRRALDVLNDKEPGLDKSSPLLGARPKGTFFYGAAIDLENLKGRDARVPQFAILQQGKYINVALGQHEGTAFYRVRFEAKSPEVAEQIGKILAGFEAMLALQAEENETLASVAEGFKWKVDESTVTVNWKANSENVVQLVKERMKHMPHHHAMHDKHDHHKHDEKHGEPKQAERQEESSPQRR